MPSRVACACIEGAERAVCDDITEAGAGDKVCLNTPMQGECPVPVGSHARLYDPATRAYTREVNVCELAG